MFRYFRIGLKCLALFAIVFSLGGTVHAQDAPPPSLGDVARKNREERAKNPQTSKRSLTNDDIVSGIGRGPTGGGPLGNSAPSARGQEVVADITGKLDHAEEMYAKLDSLDASQLGIATLQGDVHDFPGRKAWEQRLFAAKNVYVTHERVLAVELRRALRAGLALDAASGGKLDDSDPRAKAIEARVVEIGAAYKQEEAAFMAVIEEGKKLAKQ